MKVFIPVLLTLLSCRLAHAQASLSLEEALRLARQNNLQIKKQEHRQKFAELEVAIKRGQRLPSLDLSATASYTDEIAKLDIPLDKLGLPLPPDFAASAVELGGHDRADFALGVRQSIFTAGRLRAQVDLAKTALQGEETRLALLQQQTAYQIHLLFYQAQNLKKENKIQVASLNRLTTQLTQTRHLLQAAQVVAYDTLQVFNQALQVKILIEQNLRDQRLVDLQMARVLDLVEVRPIVESELPRVGEFNYARDSLKQAARQARPELRGVRLSQKSAQLNRTLARGNYFPEIGAEAKYHYGKPGLNQGADEWMDYTTVGVSLQWNLWRGQQDRHRVEEAEIEYTRLTLEERELVRTVEYEVERSWENMKYATRQIALAEQLLAQQQERYRIVSTQQREGVATTNDVIVAESDLTQAELQLQRALIQYYVSQSEMRLATGAMLE